MSAVTRDQSNGEDIAGEDAEDAVILPGFVKLTTMVKRNPHLFNNLRALQAFIADHRDELVQRRALARLSAGRTAANRVHPRRLEEFMLELPGRDDAK